MCRNYENDEECKWGDNCIFAHGEHELRTPSQQDSPREETSAVSMSFLMVLFQFLRSFHKFRLVLSIRNCVGLELVVVRYMLRYCCWHLMYYSSTAWLNYCKDTHLCISEYEYTVAVAQYQLLHIILYIRILLKSMGLVL